MPDDSGGSVNRREFLTIGGAVLGGIAAGTTVTAAESTEQFIVKTGGVDMADLRASVDEVVHDMDDTLGYAVVRGAESDVETHTSSFEPDIEYELDLPSTRADVPDARDEDVETLDTDALLYDAQWDKQAQDIPAVHDTTTGEGTRVSIVDTGIGTFPEDQSFLVDLITPDDDVPHPDLNVNLDLSTSVVDDGTGSDTGFHGTAVAGVVAAQGEGILGTAPDTELVSVRVFEGGFGGTTFGTVIAAIDYSVDIDSDVANLSLGAYPVPRQGIGEFYGGVLNKATARANSNGTLLVASAGNDGADLQDDGGVISLPNEAANTMSISATAPDGFDPIFGFFGPDEPPETPTTYTNYGTNAVDVSAPGGDLRSLSNPYDLVLTTSPPLNVLLPYIYISGTSFSAPQVAGAAALVRSVDPGAPPSEVQSVLGRTAVDPKDVPGDKAFHGRGFLDPGDAVEAASGGGGGEKGN
ncbi:peptidase S8 and S53 subtilisin kexin sedolisin [Halobacteriales archaeon SW_7_71_33]|nr:MAG: peptidase S8 and S53 subtilisin kexin sedolisin [Halobacteriales archaeon SW_7_71_33]